jgi:hypothetical protein
MMSAETSRQENCVNWSSCEVSMFACWLKIVSLPRFDKESSPNLSYFDELQIFFDGNEKYDSRQEKFRDSLKHQWEIRPNMDVSLKTQRVSRVLNSKLSPSDIIQSGLDPIYSGKESFTRIIPPSTGARPARS